MRRRYMDCTHHTCWLQHAGVARQSAEEENELLDRADVMDTRTDPVFS